METWMKCSMNYFEIHNFELLLEILLQSGANSLLVFFS